MWLILPLTYTDMLPTCPSSLVGQQKRNKAMGLQLCLKESLFIDYGLDLHIMVWIYFSEKHLVCTERQWYWNPTSSNLHYTLRCCNGAQLICLYYEVSELDPAHFFGHLILHFTRARASYSFVPCSLVVPRITFWVGKEDPIIPSSLLEKLVGSNFVSVLYQFKYHGSLECNITVLWVIRIICWRSRSCRITVPIVWWGESVGFSIFLFPCC